MQPHKYSGYLLLCCALFFANCGKQVDVPGNSPHFLNARFLQGDSVPSYYTKRSYDAVPSIEISQNNELYAAWFGSAIGGIAEGNGNFIIVAYSPDQGLTWTKNKFYIAPKYKEDRYWAPSFFKDAENNIILCFSALTRTSDNGRSGIWATKLNYDKSGDSIAYTQPTFFLNEILMVNKPLILKDKNEIVFSPVIYGKEGRGIHFYKSNYTMFEDLQPQLISAIPSSADFEYSEPTCIELDTTNYLTILRTKSGLYSSSSSNLINWSAPQPYTAVNPTTSTKSNIVRLRSNALLLTVNLSKTARINITSFLSNDNGQTWQYNMLIDRRDQVSYPDVAQDSDGNIYTIYDWNRSTDRNIIIAKYTEQDIINNNVNGIKKTVINP